MLEKQTRELLVKAYEKSHNASEVARNFSVNRSTVYKYVKDIFVACHDNLTGLCTAINSIFPRTKNQLCIVHQVRNSCKFVPYKDRKAVCADLKKFTEQ